jgi:hypothetical protein
MVGKVKSHNRSGNKRTINLAADALAGPLTSADGRMALIGRGPAATQRQR